MCSTSMLPVSGAAQLVASGAMCGLRPRISHSGAYSRFDKPSGARGECGRNRFHNPAARAFSFKSSMILVATNASPLRRFSATSAS